MSDLLEVLGRIRKRWGDESGYMMNESPKRQVEVIPSGILSLDIALGVGGYPLGRIIEIYGENGTGKSTLALHAIAQAQKNGGTAVFVDAEHALDIRYAEALGVDPTKLIICQPNSGEQALEIVKEIVASPGTAVVVVDSVAALVPEAEVAGEMGEAQMGLQARLMGQAMRKLVGPVSTSNTCLIFLNQVRMNMNTGPWGPSTTTPGGKALPFAASVRLEIKRLAGVDGGTDKERIGHDLRIKVAKNRLAPPFKEAETEIIYGVGVSRFREAIRVGEKFGIVTKSGSWYSVNGEKLGQGLANSAQALEKDMKLLERIEQEVLKSI